MRCARGGGGGAVVDAGDGGGDSVPEAASAGMPGLTSRRAFLLALALLVITALLLVLEEQPLPLWATARGGPLQRAGPPAAATREEDALHGRLEDATKAVSLNATTPVTAATATATTAPRRPRPVAISRKGVKVFEGEPVVGEYHIFFVETSCALDYKPDPVPYDSESGLRLSPRAACALESAAAAHPTHHVYLVHTCAVKRRALARRAAPAYALAALAAPNVRLWTAHYSRLYFGTPLEALLAGGALRRSYWPVVHASDILRFLLLWKYGGTYLDTDVLMLRSMGEEKNFGCAESTEDVSVGAFNFAMDEIGRRVANACIAELLHYRPDLWSYNGPGAITRALKNICNVGEISHMTENKCGGFRLLPTSTFYAIPWQNWNLFFTEEGADETLKKIGDNMAVHVWNALSHNTSVDTSSKQPYAQIARRVCPNVVAAMGDTM